MQRRNDWLQRLQDFLISRLHAPFVWGGHDCGLFCADAILAMTDADLAVNVRGLYDSEKKAKNLIEAAANGQPNSGNANNGKPKGGDHLGSFVSIIASQRGMQECEPSRARRGDLVMWKGKGGHTLGIVSLDGVHAVFPGPEGLIHIRLRYCDRAWRVG